MRKLMMLAAAGVLFCGLALVKADDDTKVTIEGDGMCAKCALKETKTCQNAVIVTKDGKKTTYYLVHEGVSKKSHGSMGFCQGLQGRPDQGQGHRHRREEGRQALHDRREDREGVSSSFAQCESAPRCSNRGLRSLILARLDRQPRLVEAFFLHSLVS